MASLEMLSMPLRLSTSTLKIGIYIAKGANLAELPRLLTDAPSATLLSRLSSKSEGSESESRDVVLGGDR